MANIIFVALTIELAACLGYAIFFFLQATTWDNAHETGVLISAVVYTIYYVAVMGLHYLAEAIYTYCSRRATYNDKIVNNCRSVWNIRICCPLFYTATLILLWVMVGTESGMHMLKDYDKGPVESHGGKHGDLLLLHDGQRLTYTGNMFILLLLQFLALIVIVWNIMGYSLGDTLRHTYNFVEYVYMKWVRHSPDARRIRRDQPGPYPWSARAAKAD